MTQDNSEGVLDRVVTNSDEFYIHPNEAFDGPRPSLAHSEYGTEILAFARVREAFRDKRMIPRTVEYFERLGASPLILEFVREGNTMTMAPDKHDRIRPILLKAFTPARIDAFRPDMRRIADELIDAFIDRGECDLVADFAHTFPIAVLARLTGVPSKDVPLFSDATMQLRLLGQIPFQPTMHLLDGALRFLYDYVEKLVEERRAAPNDDFVGALIELQASGEKLNETELVWAIVFLMLGGHDTTRFTLAGCFHSLIAHDYWEKIAAEPALIPDAIQESMRICPGTPRQMRVVETPLEIDGVRLEKDTVVSLNLNAAGRDKAAFPEAETFTCPRSKPSYDVGFGFGRFSCIGQLLARAEMAEAIERITSRLTNVTFDGPKRLKPTGVIGGYDSLPVRFSRRD